MLLLWCASAAAAQGVGGVPVTSAPVVERDAPRGQKALFFGFQKPFLLARKLDMISDYLFRSSYMPVKPYGMGFSGIFRIGRYSHNRLNVFRFSR